jgi:phosphoserine phosphatase RsbU/P
MSRTLPRKMGSIGTVGRLGTVAANSRGGRMRLYFRWKLFAGFFGFALVVAGVLVVWLLREVSGGQLISGNAVFEHQLHASLLRFLSWALLILAGASIPPALWIASRLNRPISLLHEGMQKVASGRLETVVPHIRTYDEFEPLIDNFNSMVAGLRELVQTRMQLQVAREIQLSLLPESAPCVEGFEIAGASHPAEEVGGDYFDYLPMPGGHLGLVIGDVVGHGLGSALVMAATRTCLRSLIAADYSRAEEIIDRANKVLLESTPDNCFVTLTLLQLDPAARVVRYVNCGHVTGYLLDSKGSIKARLSSTALPLGCLPEFEMEPAPDLSLETGDMLVMLTDGVTEAESPEKHSFGEERALEVVRANLDAPAIQIVRAIHEAAREFSHANSPRDDITSLVVRVGPPGPGAPLTSSTAPPSSA